MRIKNLKLKNFRNYGDLDIDFAGSFNVIYGNNAQGKTNIIEAIFLCASGRSHRTSKDIELLKYGAPGFRVALALEKDGNEEVIEINFTPQEKKKIRINEIPLKRIGDLLGHLNAVIFSPEDLLIIKQGPAERRRFTDIILSQLRTSYFYDLQQYAKILYQRNTLLKNINGRKDLESTLEVWDRHLVNTGTRIMSARRSFVKKLAVLAAARHEILSNDTEKLSLKYSPSVDLGDDDGNEMIAVKYMKLLEKNRWKEIQKGTSIFGPHRDDIDIILNGESTKIYGSQGQQRTSVLSMKLAEIDLIKEETENFPVLLLDDVMSELDDSRKGYLMESIHGMQTFIACTEKRFFMGSGESAWENARFFNVKNGVIY